MEVIVLCFFVIYMAYVSSEECSSICHPRIYKPVCGGPRGGPYATFNNDCKYKYADCENGYSFVRFSEGVCKEECAQACTLDYTPVCAGPRGGPYTTYSNKCEFDMQNCEKKFKEFIVYTGDCEAESNSTNTVILFNC